MKNETLERWIRDLAARCGLDIKRLHPERTPEGRLAAMLASQRIDLVLDVGANTGQFALALRAGGYRGRILSFEPLSAAHRELERVSGDDSKWAIAPRVAIGERETEIELHVAGNTYSSSILDMLDSHARAAPDSTYIGVERVRMARLDALALPELASIDAAFLKIDTQGFEDRVLDGAPNVLARCRGVQLELSLVPLYAGQALHDELIARLRKDGFELWGMWPGLYAPDSGRMLQVDAVLFRGSRA
jgi:FkbM family methyltransferase